MSEKLLFRTRMRATDKEIVRALESRCRAIWSHMHECRRLRDDPRERFWQDFNRKAAIDAWFNLRELLAIRRGQ